MLTTDVLPLLSIGNTRPMVTERGTLMEASVSVVSTVNWPPLTPVKRYWLFAGVMTASVVSSAAVEVPMKTLLSLLKAERSMSSPIIRGIEGLGTAWSNPITPCPSLTKRPMKLSDAKPAVSV
jgi:hypothetical protein